MWMIIINYQSIIFVINYSYVSESDIIIYIYILIWC